MATHHDPEHFGRMWALLLLGNLVGAFIFAWIFARTEAIDPVLRPALDVVAAAAAHGTFAEAFHRAFTGSGAWVT